jgi:hypothetical protein
MSDQKPKKEWAGVVGAITGIFALILSAGTMYFNIIRQKDDLRVAFGVPPEFTLDFDNSQFEVANEQTMTFINSGNRAATVPDIELWIEQSGRAVSERQQCNEAKTGVSMGYIFEPPVVRPGEISIVKVKLNKLLRSVKPPASKIKFSSENATKSH